MRYCPNCGHQIIVGGYNDRSEIEIMKLTVDEDSMVHNSQCPNCGMDFLCFYPSKAENEADETFA